MEAPPEETPEPTTANLLEEVAEEGGPRRAPIDGPPTSGELPPDTSRPHPEETRYWSERLALRSPRERASNETATSRLRRTSFDADMDRGTTDLGRRKMSGPAGPDPATLGRPRVAVEGTQSPPDKVLSGVEKEKKASVKKRKRGGEDELNWPRLRSVKLRCTSPPPILTGKKSHGRLKPMGRDGGSWGGGGTHKINGKINKYYYGRVETGSKTSGKAINIELSAACPAGTAAAKGSIVGGNFVEPLLETSGVNNSGEASQGSGGGREGPGIPPTLANGNADSSEARHNGPALRKRNVNAVQTVSEPPGKLKLGTARDIGSITSLCTPNLAQRNRSDAGGGQGNFMRPPCPVSSPNREEGGGETLETTTEVEIESSGSAKAGGKARASRQLAATTKAPITKLITKNNDIIKINMGLTPLSLPQHHTPILTSPNPTNIHPCPLPNPNIHTAITPPTQTTTSTPKYLDPEGTCDVRANGDGDGNYANSNGDNKDGKNLNLKTVLFSVGTNEATRGEERSPPPRRTTARMTTREKRERKSLVEEARSRHLKVGSKSSAEIQKMISKDKRTQPSLRDLLSRKEENNTTYEEAEVKEEEEEEREEKEEEETAVGERRILVKSWSNISETKEEIVERREGQCQELDEEEGGGSETHTKPYPTSVMPNAMKGEDQEGRGGCSTLGVGNRILGPAPNNIKPPKSLGGPVEDECHLYSSRK